MKLRTLPHLVAMLGLLLMPAAASAHVLFKDTSGFNGAVIHFAPADDPVAGVPGEVFIDLQNGVTAETYALTLTVAPKGKWPTVIPIQAHGSTISSKYTFPETGQYDLSLLAEPITAIGPTLTYNYTQTVDGTADKPAPPRALNPWALAGLAAAGLAAAGLATIGYLKRKNVKKS